MTTLFGTVDSAERPIVEEAIANKKHGWLPILTVLFLVSYALMTMLIIEQGQTIESQRALIRELFRDSKELSAVRMRAQEQHSQLAQAPSALMQSPAAQAQSNRFPSTQIPSTQIPSTQIPSTQIPSTQAPQSKTPSSQASAAARAQNEAAKSKSFQMPSRPGTDLAEPSRSLLKI